MSADFRQGERYAPGVYAYAGSLHIDEDEFIRAAGGDPSSPLDRVRAERAIAKVCAEHGIAVQEIEPS